VEIQVAGQRFQQTFAPQANLVMDPPFVWDGLDGYGRPVQGAHAATVRVEYVYRDPFYAFPANAAQSFGMATGVSIATDIVRSETRVAREYSQNLRVWSTAGQDLGGWSLSEHHAYDPSGQVLYLGDGTQRSVDVFAGRLLAGNGAVVSAGDDGPALEASFWERAILGLALAPDGSLYVTDNYAIRKIDPSGIITTAIGDPTKNDGNIYSVPCPWFGAESGPDGSVHFASDWAAGNCGTYLSIAPNGSVSGITVQRKLADLAFGPDGSLYATRPFSNTFPPMVVTRVEPDGTELVVAGGGTSSPGDGDPATSALLTIQDQVNLGGYFTQSIPIAVDADGAIYLATRGRIQRVGPDGIIDTVAGNGVPGTTNDGGPAKLAQVQPRSLSFGPDGTLFFGELDRIRALRTDGTVVTVLLTPGVVNGITVSPEGTLYYSILNQVFVVDDVFPSQPENALYRIASEDGLEVHVFDSSGRHLRTEHGLTGAVLRTFGYQEFSSGNGTRKLLVTITDSNPTPNVTTIQRSVDGTPTAIVGPFGRVTALGTDPVTGYLTSVTNEEAESYLLDHDAEGLLGTLTTPRGHSYVFDYDDVGRLELDTDPETGFTALVRTIDGDDIVVTATSGEGVVTTKRSRIGLQGAESRANTDGAGFDTTVEIGADGASRTTTALDADDEVITQTTSVAGPDPRFGFQTPVIGSLTITTPLRTFERTTDRTADIDPLTGALETLTDEISVNGKPPTTIDFDAAASTLTTVSPEGLEVVRTIDALGRTTEIVVGPPPGSGGFHPLRFEYDARGRLEFMRQGTGGLERVTQLAYDADGNLELVIDPLHTTELGYDDANRVEVLIRPDLQQVGFGYHPNGNLGSLTPPGRPAHGFAYTAVDQESLYTPPGVPGAGATTTHYDLDRRIDDIVRPDASVLDFTFVSLDTRVGVVGVVDHPAARDAERVDASRGVVFS
jgi:YD repeat-containing protein